MLQRNSRPRFHRISLILIPALLCASSLATEYRTPAEITTAARALADGSSSCTASTIGSSGNGSDLTLLTLSSGNAEQNPAFLITAGLDGRRPVDSETALRVAENILTNHPDLLDNLTIYILPLVNPDGLAHNQGAFNPSLRTTLTPLDNDRDGASDEDGPVDLNGDGYITQIRRLNPPLDDPPTHLADPAAPRLLKKPDPLNEETATYTLYPEGLDQDHDGLIAEDGPGGIDLDRNFMHGWPAFSLDAGPVPLSESEALALAQFVIDHPRIVAALTYGRHDNLVKPPDGKGKGPEGRSPKNIDSGDVKLYKEISELYKDITGQKIASKEDIAGSFHAWLYAQRGIPSFASTVWGRPKPEKKNGEEKKEAPSDAPDKSPADPVSGTWTGSLNIPQAGEMDFTITMTLKEGNAVSASFDSMMSFDLTGTYDPGSGSLTFTGDIGEGMTLEMDLTIDGNSLSGTTTGPDGESIDIKATRSGEAPETGEGKKGNKKDKKNKPADEDAAAWLKYSDDQRDGAGFVEWTPFDHPTLGPVEIGGFVPGFKLNPPADELDELAKKQTDFIIKLLEKRPRLTIKEPQVEMLSAGLYDIHFALINEGFLPTKTAMAVKNRATLPTVVRLSSPVERIVSGDRVSRVWAIPGSGGRSTHHWIIKTEPGETVTVTILNQQFGDQTITIPLGGTK